MRFPQLKIGQQFEYQGKRYTKSGPLTASEVETGASVMIRRSAEVKPFDKDASVGVAKQVKQNYTRDELLALCKEYRTQLIQESQKIAKRDNTLQLEQLFSIINDRDLLESLF
jgi:hypothetical protein